jgi:hypothetical protein
MIKKFLFSAAFALACNFGFASTNADLFQVNEEELNVEFAQLNELESYVNSNEGVTMSSMETNSPLLQNVTTTGDALGILSAYGEPPLGIPSFLWGFCFNVAGVAIVYFVADDRDETKKAFIGCVVVNGISILFWLVYVVILGASGFLFF